METQARRFPTGDRLFSNGSINRHALYLELFDAIPQTHWVTGINGEKAMRKLRELYGEMIETEFVDESLHARTQKFEFEETLFVLKNRVVIQIDPYWCEILHDETQTLWARECLKVLSAFKQRRKRRPLEMNILISGKSGLELRSTEVKRTRLDIDRFYEDDFKPVHEQILKRLKTRHDKGVVLLHGLPGTGKTSYLRYLIGKVNKEVIFLPPSMAEGLTGPHLIELLISHPGSILVIEDAENVIMDRKLNGAGAVSNLLNVSDGLLADFLQVQIICTFNNALSMVDPALMREGRLIARYEFGRLSVEKAQALNEHLGLNRAIVRPMTLAEITHPGSIHTRPVVQNPIGFRRAFLEN